MHRTRTCLTLAVAGLAAGTLAVPILSGPADAAPLPSRSVVRSDGGYITSYHFSNGDSVTAYAASPMTMSASVAPAAAPRTSQDTTAPAESSSSGQLDPDRFDAATYNVAYATTTDEQALSAIGVSGTEVSLYQAQDTDVINSPTARPVTASRAATANFTVTPHIALPADRYPMIGGGPKCVSAWSDGNRVHMYGCDREFRVWSNDRDWYVEDKFLASVISYDQAIIYPDRPTGLKFGLRYPSGNRLYDWSPNTSRPMGSCVTTSASASVTVQNVTYQASNSAVECPETFGPIDFTPTLFTAKWDGQGNGPNEGNARNVHGVAAWHSPATVVPSNKVPSLVWTYWWT